MAELAWQCPLRPAAQNGQVGARSLKISHFAPRTHLPSLATLCMTSCMTEAGLKKDPFLLTNCRCTASLSCRPSGRCRKGLAKRHWGTGVSNAHWICRKGMSFDEKKATLLAAMQGEAKSKLVANAKSVVRLNRSSLARAHPMQRFLEMLKIMMT